MRKLCKKRVYYLIPKNSMLTKNIMIEQVSTNLLKGATYNPRKHSKESAAQLKESIQRYGLVDPIICNIANERKNVVIGGHFRLEIAKELNMTTVPVVYVDIPDLEKEKELNIRLNRNTGEWDFEKLKDFNIDTLTDIGFDSGDLADIWDDDVCVEEENFDVEKEFAKIGSPKTKLGDIIELGSHRLICGSSLDPETIKKLFGNEKASMIYSDPVYNIDLDYNKGLGGKQNYGGNVVDKRTDDEYKEFLKKSLVSALTVVKDDCHVFYWNTEQHIWIVQTLYRELGISNKRVCLWIKNGFNPTPLVAFSKCYEPCIYGTLGSPYLSKKEQGLTEVLNKDIASGNDSLDEINIWTAKRVSSKDYAHATTKPVDLHEKPILRCTKPGDIILDSFGGSGSTLIAAEQLRRKAYLVELEPIFCDLIIKRFEKLTGKKAKTLNRDEKESTL